MDFIEKISKNQNRVGQNIKEVNFMQMIAEDVLPMAMKCLLILNKA